MVIRHPRQGSSSTFGDLTVQDQYAIYTGSTTQQHVCTHFEYYTKIAPEGSQNACFTASQEQTLWQQGMQSPACASEQISHVLTV